MKIEYIEKNIVDINADIELILVVNKDFEHRFVKSYKNSLEAMGFKGEQDEIALLAESKKIFAGANSLSSSDVRSAVATAMRSLIAKEYKSLKLASYTKYEKCTATLRALAEGLELGNYNYERYKSTKSNKIKEVFLSSEGYNDFKIEKESLLKAIKKGVEVASSVNFTRDIVNTPPDDFYPKIMAKVAKDIAKEYNLECKILKEKDIKNENMNALLAVARASAHKPRVIHLAYKPKNPKAVISIIGKGLTYDSGGLSLKPSDFMVTMKADKSGGAAVLGIMQAVSKLGLDVEVHGFIGAVENMIGGNAYKPDDVLISKSGKTIEVRNTDAEGRLVLADVLTYAQQEVNADYIIDLATLTGACVVGLGQYTIGAMSNNEKLLERIEFVGNISSGELVNKLAFNRHLAKTLKSNIADICNISNTRYGGAITAGLVLENFIEEQNKDKWLHLDIAGPAFVEHEWAENPNGASGAGVRVVSRLLEKISNDFKH